MSVTLLCVNEKNKLRIKIISYIDDNGKIYNDVYNNNLNCRFPRHLREEGKMFSVPSNDVSLQFTKTGTYFYVINTKHIQTIQTIQTKIIEFKEPECVICMSNEPSFIYIPCGHYCVCSQCHSKLLEKKCPLCRTIITTINLV